VSTTGLPEVLTVVEHATWIVDHAYLPARPLVDDDGVVTPVADPGPPILAHEAIEQRIRASKRGGRREGLTVRLFLILLISCAWLRRIWVCDLHTLATDVLPLEIQRELGILHWAHKSGRSKLRTITPKQLYDLIAAIRKHMDGDPDFDLSAEQVTDRLQFLDDVKDALLYATHVLATTGTSVAIDESGVWSWMRGHAKPKDLPLVDPTDEDKNAAETIHRPVRDAADWLTGEADPVATIDPAADHPVEIVVDGLLDEDDPAFDSNRTKPSEEQPASAAEPDTGKLKKRGKRCWLSSWGVKTAKSGKRSSFFGYCLHPLLAVPDAGRGGKRASKAERYREPLLVEEFDVTPASTDIVESALSMVKKRLGRGRPVIDLLGDRHFSYKKTHRWAQPLWRLKVRQVLDLRKNDHRPSYFEGAIIIDGTPHLDPPEHLRVLQRPGRGASPQERDKFEQAVAERQKYAYKRRKTAWSRNDGKPGGDGTTRWLSPVMAGTVGCPHDPISVEVARQNGQPILDADRHQESACVGGPLWIPPGVHMKVHQEHYWGSPEWLVSWNRRTYVEGAFGLMKNYMTGNIHRGWSQLTGQALVTLGLTAVVVAYNLRELENWYARASEHCPDNPLLGDYRDHPLHQPTRWVFGVSLHTADSRRQWEQDWLSELQPARTADSIGDDDLPTAA
jgi:hypothetical protein